MLIFRVEHNEVPCGPYRIDHYFYGDDPFRKDVIALCYDLCMKHSGNDHRPVPRYTQFRTDKDVCGFTSLDELLDWFEGFDQRLKENNFSVKVYESYDYNEVKKQVLFNIENAVLVETIEF